MPSPPPSPRQPPPNNPTPNSPPSCPAPPPPAPSSAPWPPASSPSPPPSSTASSPLPPPPPLPWPPDPSPSPPPSFSPQEPATSPIVSPGTLLPPAASQHFSTNESPSTPLPPPSPTLSRTSPPLPPFTTSAVMSPSPPTSIASPQPLGLPPPLSPTVTNYMANVTHSSSLTQRTDGAADSSAVTALSILVALICMCALATIVALLRRQHATSQRMLAMEKNAAEWRLAADAASTTHVTADVPAEDASSRIRVDIQVSRTTSLTLPRSQTVAFIPRSVPSPPPTLLRSTSALLPSSAKDTSGAVLTSRSRHKIDPHASVTQRLPAACGNASEDLHEGEQPTSLHLVQDGDITTLPFPKHPMPPPPGGKCAGPRRQLRRSSSSATLVAPIVEMHVVDDEYDAESPPSKAEGRAHGRAVLWVPRFEEDEQIGDGSGATGATNDAAAGMRMGMLDGVEPEGERV